MLFENPRVIQTVMFKVKSLCMSQALSGPVVHLCPQHLPQGNFGSHIERLSLNVHKVRWELVN